MSVIIETSIGDVTVDLFTEERPRCCLNFLKLCKIKYYNFSLFHTVQPNVVAQTGDPTATGRGGESIFGKLYGEQARFFDMEVIPQIKHYKKGLISMVNNGSGMHGSQFFFTLADNLDYLDGKHTVFGEVAEGFEILDKFNNTFCGEDNRPHQDIRIYHTIILDDPFDDPDNLDIPSMSPGPTEEMLNSDHIPCDANIDEDKDKTQEELMEMMAEKEAKANTQILEMVGDLPAADVAPPENVLFVCKLNPVTTAEDLEIIFSRFGPIVSCEVIKDSKTGESLQYAFIEFECEEHCESAYFKMDNVLIDDRRIHVDFSQSVSKLKWKGKGKGVDILETGDAPVYVLKNQQRKNEYPLTVFFRFFKFIFFGYELVYEDEPGDKTKAKVEKKKKKRSTRSESEEDREKYNKKEKKRPRSHSPSPDVRKRTEVDQSCSRNEDRRRDEYRDRRKEESERGRENTRRQEEDNERRERNGKRSREDDSRRREEYERMPRRNDDREKEREKNIRGRDDRDDNRYNNKSRQDRSKYDRRSDSSDEDAIRGYSSKKSNSNDDIYSRNTSHSKSQLARSKYDKGNSAGQEQTREGYSSKRGNSEDSDTAQHKRSEKKKKDKNKRQTVESSHSESSESNYRKKKSESPAKKKKKSKKSHKSRRQSTSSSED
ncbi:peptidyl-prolyl cis-trans isomerase-like 4 isoform X2 [Biomphalaria pfeifferi]|uniref:Peptidyl-prolyl cis-trans isomerase n=1 Tax=Biomphalaria pfeifferi TaxID=112525 RepID=A0AAD8FI97_BIOPF|nr:peptidyl-prolyl cis-trans isomerase-like 4 isoform X2 [Biomphalaria pfeifferi]